MEDPEHILQLMIAQFRENLAPLTLRDPGMNPDLWEQLQQDALPVFKQAARHFVEASESNTPDAIPRLVGAISELAAAVQEQIESSGRGDRSDVARAISLNPIQKSLRRICPLFPFC